MNVVDASGRTVLLRGFNAGGTYLMETWMSALDSASPPPGFPPVIDECSLWKVMRLRFGLALTQQLQQTWRNAWFNPSDVSILASMGVNVVRIGFFYQLVQSDANPKQLLPSGLSSLDNLINACAGYGMYVILDLHGAPGGQSPSESTGQTGLNQLFSSTAYQQQTIQLWSLLANYYRDRPEVAGYNLLNEPFGAPDSASLINLHARIYQAIRAVDPNHIIFMEDGYKGFSAFPNPSTMGWTNIVYSFHVYFANATSPAPHLNYIYHVMPRLKQQQTIINTPIWVGEFSTMNDAQGGIPMMSLYFNAFNQYGWSWTPWTFKKVDRVNGFQSIWGLYTNSLPWNQANPYTDSYSTLQTKFAQYNTANLQVQTDYQSAVMAAVATSP
ncbi:MAG TPA: cellulase family glycosylhydrolase [Bryobacteraceae bacterium]|nr:cellulase family glycosylhydrolase [Bryobacteraceae bacterium]